MEPEAVSGDEDIPAAVAQLVASYLRYHEFQDAAEAFDTQFQAWRDAGCKMPENKTKSVLAAFRSAFNDADADRCIELWESHVPEAVRRRDSTGRRLDFYLHVHLAVAGSEDQRAQAMDGFRRYLDTRGRDLSQSNDFLEYYALPFVENPRAHPLFKTLFDPDWSTDLYQRLERLMMGHLADKHAAPALYQLARQHLQENQAGVTMQQLQDQLARVQHDADAMSREVDQAAEANQQVVGLAHQLMDAVEAAARGSQIPGEFVYAMRVQLGAMAQLTATPTARTPATGGGGGGSGGGGGGSSGGGGGGGGGGGAAQQQQDDASPHAASASGQQQQQQQGGGGGDARRDIVPNPAVMPDLDWPRVRQDLLTLARPYRLLLLQALRWRLTRTRPGQQRRAVVQAMIANDVLGCAPGSKYAHVIEEIVRTTEIPEVREYALRFINALVDQVAGRNYVLNCSYLIELLSNILHLEPGDTRTRQNALGILQKLSLRKHVKQEMIALGVIKWVVKELEDPDSLAEYTIEFATALLMNLCNHPQGRVRAADPRIDILSVLTGLMEHDDSSVTTYVHGVLCCVLHNAALKDKAEALGIRDILLETIPVATPEFAKQMHMIISVLDMPPLPDPAPGDDGDDDDGEASDTDEDVDDDDDDDDDVDGDGGDEPYANLEWLLDAHDFPEIINGVDLKLPYGEALLASRYAADGGADAQAQDVHSSRRRSARGRGSGGGGDAEDRKPQSRSSSRRGTSSRHSGRAVTPRKRSYTPVDSVENPWRPNYTLPRTPPDPEHSPVQRVTEVVNPTVPSAPTIYEKATPRQWAQPDRIDQQVAAPSGTAPRPSKAALSAAAEKSGEDVGKLEYEHNVGFVARSKLAHTPAASSVVQSPGEFDQAARMAAARAAAAAGGDDLDDDYLSDEFED